MRKYFLTFCAALLSGCAGLPKGAQPVNGFEVNRYLGVWHEVARLDHSFERGLVNVTAEYSLRPDGGLKVVNRGFSPAANKWKEAVGRAYFTGDKTAGRLKVSFFRPFYGGYNIIDLDKDNYSYALVCGPNLSYLWILAREPGLPGETLARLKAKAAALGFAADKLIFPGK